MMGDYYNPNNFGACDNRFFVDDIENTFSKCKNYDRGDCQLSNITNYQVKLCL